MLKDVTTLLEEVTEATEVKNSWNERCLSYQTKTLIKLKCPG